VKLRLLNGSLCRHFIRHSVDGPGELSITQSYWLILENQKIVLGSKAQLGSPARCQADHSRRVGIAAYIPGTPTIKGMRFGRARDLRARSASRGRRPRGGRSRQPRGAGAAGDSAKAGSLRYNFVFHRGGRSRITVDPLPASRQLGVFPVLGLWAALCLTGTFYATWHGYGICVFFLSDVALRSARRSR
jgi:hypothetical protein